MPFVEVNIQNEIEKQRQNNPNLERHGTNPVPSINS